MKNIQLNIIIFLSSMVVLPANLKADTLHDTEFWKQVVATKSLLEIAILMDEGRTPAWPEIKSIRQVVDIEGTKQIALITALHEKMKQSFDTGDTTQPTVATYSKISSRLQAAGGYSNVLLADCFNQLVLFRVTGWLLDKSKSLDDAKAICREWKVPSVNDPKVWLERFQDDDPEVKAAKENFHKIEPGAMFYPSTIGIKSSGKGLNLENYSFNHLIQRPSVLTLMWRFSMTEMPKVVCVPGFIAFTERGGKPEELDLKDVGPFESRMGKLIEELKYPPLGIRNLDISSIQFSYNLHNDPNFNAYYLNSALK